MLLSIIPLMRLKNVLKVLFFLFDNEFTYQKRAE